MARTKILAQFLAMSNPYDTEGSLLKMADAIGLNAAAPELTVDKDWTPDKAPPAMTKLDDAPSFDAFAATFGGPAAGGKGIVMNQAPVLEAETKPAPRGYHQDGSPRDAMESLEDCLNGYCAVCK